MPAAKFPQCPTVLSNLSMFLLLCFQFYCLRLTVCKLREKRVIWITITGQTGPIPVPSLPASLRGPLTWSPSIDAQTGGRDFLTYFNFNALENPQTFLFYRHAFTVALSFQQLDEDSPPRRSVLVSPARGYSSGFAHRCFPDMDHTLARALLLLLLAGWERSSRFDSGCSAGGGVAP